MIFANKKINSKTICCMKKCTYIIFIQMVVKMKNVLSNNIVISYTYFYNYNGVLHTVKSGAYNQIDKR